MLLDDILNNLQSNIIYNCCKHDKQYTNKEFYQIVCKVYSIIKDAPKDRPIVVYGHKEVYMIASFLACSFLGIAYVPIDKMYSKERIKYIVDVVNPSYVIGNDFAKEADNYTIVTFEQIENVNNYGDIKSIDMKPNDTYYILFTSGTTGDPKGVMVSYENIDSCVSWLIDITNLGHHENNYTIYNQAVFSFDLSVADIYMSLVSGANHYIGNDVSIFNLQENYQDLQDSSSNMMVLTPSVLALYCTDSKFNQELMPNLEIILFCGEVLTQKIVRELFKRFSDIKVINMYGPTECTYAVTSTLINKQDEEISIGKPKKDVEIYIVDGDKEKDNGEVGEILITGKSVAKGYINSKDDNKFITYKGKKGYLTGDLGFFKGENLFFVARKDSQIKYKGYRIELLDIENNISQITAVQSVKVKAEKDDNGFVKRIVALIVLYNSSDKEAVKKEVEERLPKYMMPQLRFVDTIPITINGKMDC